MVNSCGGRCVGPRVYICDIYYMCDEVGGENLNFIRWNMRYIRAINSCNRADIAMLVEELVNLNGGFTKKRYIWNLIRGKDFYLNLASYVRDVAKDILYENIADQEKAMDIIESVIKNVLLTTKKEEVRRNFVRNITKYVPILTIDVVPYLSPDKVRNILSGDTRILTDDVMKPFVEEVLSLRMQLISNEGLMKDLLVGSDL